jgi:2-polyprenyl-6-methoxyphenol hydroxylase-like FAD-dependent oxidoreductase
VVVTFLVAAPLAWFISPRLLARYERRRTARAERMTQTSGNKS